MATTIVTKHGTGVPPNSSLAIGELAVDPTAGKLFTSPDGTVVTTIVGGSVEGGTLDGQTLRWEAGNSAWKASSALVVTDTGNVGVGNTNPGGNPIVSGPELTIGSSVTTVPAIVLKGRNTSYGAAAYLYFENQANDIGYISGGNWNDTDTSYMNFATRIAGVTDERMRIDSAGNVGIGTTTPGFPLHIKGSGLELVEVETTNSSQSSGAFLVSGATNVQVRSYGTSSPEVIGGISTAGGGALFASDGPLVLATVGARELVLSTTNVERMRIDSAGSVIFGATATPQAAPQGTPCAAWSGAAARFEVRTSTTNLANAITFYNSGSSQVGAINTLNATTSYEISSDYRLKENVTPLGDALNKVGLLKPSRFNFIEYPEHTIDGFLAHEVQEVVPEAVSGEKDGEEMQGVDLSKLVPLLTKAIQELSAKNDALEARLGALEA